MAIIATVQAGNVLDSATWEGGVVPGPDDDARVRHNNCTLDEGDSWEVQRLNADTSGGGIRVLCSGDLVVGAGGVTASWGRTLQVEASGSLVCHGNVQPAGSYGGYCVTNAGGNVTIFGDARVGVNGQPGYAFAQTGGTAVIYGDAYAFGNNGRTTAVRVTSGSVTIHGQVSARTNNSLAIGVEIAGGTVTSLSEADPTELFTALNRNTGGDPWGQANYLMVDGVLNLNGIVNPGVNMPYVDQRGGVVNVESLEILPSTFATCQTFIARRSNLNIKNQTITVPPGGHLTIRAELSSTSGTGLTVDLSGLKIINYGIVRIDGTVGASFITDADTEILDMIGGISQVTGVPEITIKRSTVFTGIGERRRLGT